MTEKIIFTLIFAVALLFFCYLLVKWFVRSKNKRTTEDIEKLRASSKTAFAMNNFWDAVDDAKDLPQETMKGEFGRAHTDGMPETKTPTHKSNK